MKYSASKVAARRVTIVAISKTDLAKRDTAHFLIATFQDKNTGKIRAVRVFVILRPKRGLAVDRVVLKLTNQRVLRKLLRPKTFAALKYRSWILKHHAVGQVREKVNEIFG
jgi:hypothetical protein